MQGLAMALVVMCLCGAVVGSALGIVVAVLTGAPLLACALVGAVLGFPSTILILRRLGKGH